MCQLRSAATDTFGVPAQTRIERRVALTIVVMKQRRLIVNASNVQQQYGSSGVKNGFRDSMTAPLLNFLKSWCQLMERETVKDRERERQIERKSSIM